MYDYADTPNPWGAEVERREDIAKASIDTEEYNVDVEGAEVWPIPLCKLDI